MSFASSVVFYLIIAVFALLNFNHVAIAIEMCNNSTTNIQYIEPCVGDFQQVLTPIYCGNWSDGQTACRIFKYRRYGEYPNTVNNVSYDTIHYSCVSNNFYSSDQCVNYCSTINDTTTCGGDSLFCQFFNSSTGKICSNSATCTCSSHLFFRSNLFYDEFDFYSEFGALMYVTLGIRKISSETFIPHMHPSNLTIQFDNIENVIVNNKNDTHSVFCVSTVSKVKSESFTVPPNSKVEHKLHVAMLSHHTFLNVTCYHEEKYVKSVVFKITARTSCGDAQFPSLQWIIDIGCLELYYAVFRIIVLVFITLATITTIKVLNSRYPKNGSKIYSKIIKSIYVILILYPISLFDQFAPRFITKRPLYIMIIRKFGRINDNFFSESEKSIDKDRFSRAIFVPRFKTLFFGKFFVILLLFAPLVVADCDHSNVALGVFTECSTVSGVQNCQLKFNSELIFSPYQTESCLTVKDSNNDTALFIKISLKTIQKIAHLSTQYYTSDFEFAEAKVYECQNPFSGYCKHGVCPQFSKPQCLGVDGVCQISDPKIVQGVGISGCDVTTLPSLCFLDTACMYNRVVIKPFGDHYSINKVSTIETKYIFSIEAKNSEFSFTANINNVGQKYYIGNDKKVSFVINGAFADPIEFFENKFIAISGPNSYLIEASSKGNMVAGTIGAIQASTSSKLSSEGDNNFLYDSKILNINNGIVSVIPSGFNIPKNSSFPTFYRGSQWYLKDGVLLSNNTPSTSFSISLQTQSPINIVYKKHYIDLVAKFVNASGCYDCDQGSDVYIEAYSKSDPGSVSVSTEADFLTILTKSIFVTNVSTIFLVNIKTSHQSNNFILQIESQDTVQRLKIIFDASLNILLPNQESSFEEQNENNKGVISADHSDKNSSFLNMEGWFDKLFDFSNYPIFSDFGLQRILFFIFALLLTLLVVAVIIKCVVMKRMSRKKNS